MERLHSYTALAAALTLSIVAALTWDVSVVPPSPTESSTSATQWEVSAPAPLTSLPDIATALAPATSTAPQAATSPKSPKKIAPSGPSSAAATGSAAALSPTGPALTHIDDAVPLARAALVNILCFVPSGSGLTSITGSGIIVSPQGMILTNAHIGQYFLLTDRGVDCRIRIGSPAIARYKAQIVYISPLWLVANPTVLVQAEASGTGESDFAFLAITGSVGGDDFPDSFPFVPLASAPPTLGTPVVIASYGAQDLTSRQIEHDLSPTLVETSVKEVYTFADDTIDVIGLGGSEAAQEGSSGGGAIGASGQLLATLTTSSNVGPYVSRTLDAITASYIRRAYAAETGRTVGALLALPPSTAAANFSYRVPALESIIASQLPR